MRHPIKADDDSFPQWPDLVIIDGGRGQLNAAREIFQTLGLTQVQLLGVAKGPDRDAGRETLFMPDREAIKLEPRDPVLYFIQRLRDEAHRFVIGSHRKLRKKDIREAGLQENSGHRPVTQTCLAASLRHPEGDRAGLDRRSWKSSRRQRRERPQDFRVFPCAAGLKGEPIHIGVACDR